MANPNASTITLQKILDRILPFGDINPVLVNVGGYQLEPFLTICIDVYSDIVGVAFPHKWNEIKLPDFYSNALQQDYALTEPDGSSFYDVEWIERGIAIEMTSATLPKPWGYVECGRQLPQATGTIIQNGLWNNPTFKVSTFPNYMLYYGTWGSGLPAGADSGATFGNNPGPGSTYIAPTTAQSGNQANPITQIKDPNGNLQVVTTYGTCGNAQPSWPNANADPGTRTTDGTTVWTVVDPVGVGIRVLPVPAQNGIIFQFKLVGQRPSKDFTSLQDTLDPLPDKYESYFREGVIAQCYRYATNAQTQAKFEKNYKLWILSLNDMRAMEDRETEENQFVPERSIMGARQGGWAGAAYPFNSGVRY